MAEEASSGGKSRGTNSLVELVVIVAVALGLALGIQAVLVKPFRIPSRSMVPTLEVGQRVLVDRVTQRFSDPDRGDVVVFRPPAGADRGECGVDHDGNGPCPEGTPEVSDQNFIKRVVGLPGDRLKIADGRVYIDGELQDEPFIKPDSSCISCDLEKEITIPADQFFMMGDNRGGSADSRVWGPVPRDQIVGTAFFTYWPPGRVGIL